MTPEQQRIAIAEACGYSMGQKSKNGVWDVLKNGKFATCFSGKRLESATLEHCLKCLPDYCLDLNAMHKAEKVLNSSQHAEYCRRLSAPNGVGIAGPGKGICATASERAEAFLRTIGKWED